jgi:hypothetical protein
VRTDVTFRNTLVAMFFVVFLASMFGYPGGAVWIMSGAGGLSEQPECLIYP